MRFLSALAALCAVASAVPASPEVEKVEVEKMAPGVPWYRAYNGRIGDHFYTANHDEYENAVKNLGYKAEGTAAKIYDHKVTETKPFYRLYSPRATDHFYTTSMTEKNNAEHLGYRDEGITGYVYDYDHENKMKPCHKHYPTVPLYRAYSPSQKDHFYTTNGVEFNRAVHQLGYRDEGIAACVYKA